MKLKLHEAANWKTTPDNRGIIYIGDDNGEGHGDDGVTWFGRIFDPHGAEPIGAKHRFRPNEDAPDFTAPQLDAIALELRRLDMERDDYLVQK
jgi:hypothetical protein